MEHRASARVGVALPRAPQRKRAPDDVTRRLTARWKERLRKRAPDLIAALDPAVRALLGDESTATPLGGMSACPIHRRHEPAGDDSVTETLRRQPENSGATVWGVEAPRHTEDQRDDGRCFARE